jgi:NAD(P)-dependent dehydrogenase (short-subunit alcohol dehydrogenase family)
MEFEGKVAIITGGGTGIGRATARQFLDGGGSVVLNGRRTEVLQATTQELDPSGTRVAFVAGDIGKVATAQILVHTAVEKFGRVDVLVNNAGIFNPNAFLDHTEAEFDRYLDIILKGTFFASQAVIPEMKKVGGGAIVNVGSMWANQAVAATPSSAYSAAKAGVHALTQNLATEHAGDQIRVNAVAPAVVETPVYETFIPADQVGKVLSGFDAFHPIGRNGQAEDVAHAIIFLASDKSSWTTGTILNIDGGVIAGRL